MAMQDEPNELLKFARENAAWLSGAVTLVITLWTIGTRWRKTMWLFLSLAFTGPFRLADMEKRQGERDKKLDDIGSTVRTVEHEQKEMRLQLDRACSIQDAQINYLTDGFWLSDFSGRCTMASVGLCHITGRTLDEMLSEGWRSSIHPEDSDRVERMWQRSVAMGLEFRLQYRFVRPDGTTTNCSVVAKRIPHGWAGSVSIIRPT